MTCRMRRGRLVLKAIVPAKATETARATVPVKVIETAWASRPGTASGSAGKEANLAPTYHRWHAASQAKPEMRTVRLMIPRDLVAPRRDLFPPRAQ